MSPPYPPNIHPDLLDPNELVKEIVTPPPLHTQHGGFLVQPPYPRYARAIMGFHWENGGFTGTTDISFLPKRLEISLHERALYPHLFIDQVTVGSRAYMMGSPVHVRYFLPDYQGTPPFDFDAISMSVSERARVSLSWQRLPDDLWCLTGGGNVPPISVALLGARETR